MGETLYKPPREACDQATDRERLSLLVARRNELERQGHVHLSAKQTRTLAGSHSIEPLLRAACNLPTDPAGDGQRERRYQTFTYFPWTGEYVFNPPFRNRSVEYVPYYQSAAINAEQAGAERRFPPFEHYLREDPLLRGLIRSCFQLIPAPFIQQRLPVFGGLHMIRLKSDGHRICAPSPNTLHVDSEPFTAIVLIDRENVASHSARSYVATRRCSGEQPQDVRSEEILADLTLSEPLELLLVDDARVSHAVTGALGAGERPGFRSSLLIDFTGIELVKTSEPKR